MKETRCDAGENNGGLWKRRAQKSSGNSECSLEYKGWPFGRRCVDTEKRRWKGGVARWKIAAAVWRAADVEGEWKGEEARQRNDSDSISMDLHHCTAVAGAGHHLPPVLSSGLCTKNVYPLVAVRLGSDSSPRPSLGVIQHVTGLEWHVAVCSWRCARGGANFEVRRDKIAPEAP